MATETLTIKTGSEGSPDETLTAVIDSDATHTIALKVEYTSSEGEAVVFSPTGAGSSTGLIANPSGYNWQCAGNTSDTTYVEGWNYPPGTKADLYTFTFGTPSSFSSLKLSLYGYTNYVWNRIAPYMKMGASTYTGSYVVIGYDSYWQPYEWTFPTNPITGSAWQVSDLSSMEFGLSTIYGSLSSVRANHYEVELLGASYSYTPTLCLYVDGILEDSEVMDTTIPDNSNNWVWYPNPYWYSASISTSN